MDQNSSLAEGYDFKTKAGITAILVAVRKSNISSAEKNELRDLVFLYTSGGGDESIRISLEQKLKAHNIKPAVAEVIPPPPVLPFGTFRPVPTFKSPEASLAVEKQVSSVADITAATVPDEVVVAKPTPIIAAAPHQAPVSSTSNLKSGEVPTAITPSALVEERPVVKSALNSVMPKPIIEPETRTSTVPVANPITINRAPVEQDSNSINSKVVESIRPLRNDTTSTPVARPVIPTINTKYLERIRKIKADVNTKVGNPVNLVDIDNQVGREYMNALLEAMKRLNGGVAGELDAAMERLEAAYLAVEKVVSARSIKTEVVEPAVSMPKPEKAPEPEAPKLAQDKPPVLPKVPASVDLPEDMVVTKMMPRAAGESAIPLATVNLPKSFAPISSVGVVKSDTETQATKPPVKTPENTPNTQTLSSSIHKPISSESVANPVNSTSNRIENKIPTLAEERKLPTFNDVPAVLPTNANEIENPLYTSEIDAGLDQLLSDWSLFKKSGLFGTGPKGREHPLFKKIANLQIPLLLAGRFEGANQEIRQSITDYMNGWRYEQGIIYEQGETFEIYLRRVIKHIIDLQKRRVTA